MSSRYGKSQELLQQSSRFLAGGVSSPFRAQVPAPLFFREGRGSRLEDVDGNEYVDYGLAWGPMILGYGHPLQVERIRRAASRALTYGAQHELELDVAERLCRLLPCAGRILFSSTGSEAVQLALRLARAFTGREKILKFEGHYHGWMDSILVSYRPALEAAGPLERPLAVAASRGQSSCAVREIVAAPWNEPDILEEILKEHEGRIAAMIMEPVLCNSGCLLPRPGYLERVRDLCRRHEILLIFDEVITGFRMAPGGAQQVYGVTPDLAVYGKAVAGGATLSVVAGREVVVLQAAGGGVAFGGTLNGNPLALASADCTLELLSADDGAALRKANRLGEELASGLRRLALEHDVPLLVTGFGTALCLHFTDRRELHHYRDTLEDDREALARCHRRALEEGIHFLPDGRFYTSIAHTGEDVERTLEAFGRILPEFRRR